MFLFILNPTIVKAFNPICNQDHCYIRTTAYYIAPDALTASADYRTPESTTLDVNIQIVMTNQTTIFIVRDIKRKVDNKTIIENDTNILITKNPTYNPKSTDRYGFGGVKYTHKFNYNNTEYFVNLNY